MKSGVWTPPLLSRRHPWRHQSASPLMSQLTQIEFTGDTCGTFCLPRSYYKNNRMLHLPGRFTGVCGRPVKWGPAIRLGYSQGPEYIDLFFWSVSCQTDVDCISNSCDCGSGLLPARLRWLRDASSHYRAECHGALPPATSSPRSRPCQAFPLPAPRNWTFSK